ncbi:O-antigen ligase family protein [Microbacterium sp. JC 701]|uniref:O-antigen ligase family protein n=1 Tax=Microbacterium sp. JC 701 TaxID=2897389 RepID=UPI001E51DBD8|nr:O-antigen ligase family protein [Microbacterium sp. JC 701]MCD2170216.1 O-antigen ligase family protein [Microbacterium sp. JC 701]
MTLHLRLRNILLATAAGLGVAVGVIVILNIARSTSVGAAVAIPLGGAALIAVLLSKYRIPILVAAISLLGLAPMPSGLNLQFSVGGGTLFPNDLLAPILILCCLRSASSLPRLVKVLLLLGGLAWAFGIFWGILNSAEIGALIRDGRGFLYAAAVTLGVTLTLLKWPESAYRWLLWLVAAIVGLTSLAVALETFTGAGLFAMRADEAVLYVGGQTFLYDSARLVPPAAQVCVAVLAVVIAVWASQRGTSPVRPTILIVTLLSTLFVVAVGVSRNNVVAIVVILVAFFILTKRKLRWVTRMTLLLSAAVMVSAFVSVALAQYVPSVAARLSGVGDAFFGRALQGLDPDTIASDASANWRTRETDAALQFVREHPLTGSGFGVPYRDRLLGDPFSGDYGFTYVHNFFVWILVKLGVPLFIVVFGAFLVLVVRLCVRVTKGTDSGRSAQLGLALAAGFGIVSAVAPLAISRTSSILIGAIFALLLYPLAGEKQGRSASSEPLSEGESTATPRSTA